MCFLCAISPINAIDGTHEAVTAAESGKPVYDDAQVVRALTTFDGAASSAAWAADMVTFSISTGPIAWGEQGYRSEYRGYVDMTEHMQATAREAFALWDDLVAIDLIALDNDPTADILFNYSGATSGNGTYAASAFAWTDTDRADWAMHRSQIWLSDNWWSHDTDSDLRPGGYGVMTYLHEIGHALGLTHPGNYNGSGSFGHDAAYHQDTRAYTVQSYFNANANGSGTDHVADHGGRQYGATPLLHDIMAVQRIYGADMTTRTGDTTYGFNADTGRAAFDFTRNTEPVVAIWDAGGIDTLDLSGFDRDQRISLQPGAFSDVGSLTRNLAIAEGAVIENAIGGAGDDHLRGNAADNRLDGGAGADTMVGGAGNDIYVVDDAGDRVRDMGGGRDTIEASVSTALHWHLGVVENLVLTGTADLRGDGNGQNNRIRGNDGDNRLDGRAGRDILIGGPGDDTYVLRGPGDLVVERAGEGRDSVYVSFSHKLGWHGHHTEWLILTDPGGARLTGNRADNRIWGNDGDDRLDGGGGADHLSGGGGNDTYVLDDRGDVVRESADEGIDRIYSWVGHDMSDHTELLILLGSADLDATGNAADNRIWGNAGDNRMYGGAGADWLTGRGGDDTYVLDSPGDLVRERPGEGVDHVLASFTHKLRWHGEHTEALTLTGRADIDGAGNGQDNRITGNSGDNRLDGGAGDDVLIGREGSDIYLVDSAGDQVIERAGEGLDQVFSWVTHALTTHTEWLALMGSGDIDGAGNAAENRLWGTAGDNRLEGRGGDDRVTGKAGADILIGGAGDDHLRGGSGADRFVFEGAFGADRIADFATGNRGDVIDLSGVAAIADWSDLTAPGSGHLRSDVAGNAVFDDLAGNTVTLTGVSLWELAEGDFLF